MVPEGTTRGSVAVEPVALFCTVYFTLFYLFYCILSAIVVYLCYVGGHVRVVGGHGCFMGGHGRLVAGYGGQRSRQAIFGLIFLGYCRAPPGSATYLV